MSSFQQPGQCRRRCDQRIARPKHFFVRHPHKQVSGSLRKPPVHDLDVLISQINGHVIIDQNIRRASDHFLNADIGAEILDHEGFVRFQYFRIAEVGLGFGVMDNRDVGREGIVPVTVISVITRVHEIANGLLRHLLNQIHDLVRQGFIDHRIND